MNYNEVFTVYDNGGETVDRYTVFLTDEPESGALGLSENPTDPWRGFSQWGDFDIEAVEQHSRKISFDKLPEKVQKHVVDRFELNEESEFECTECGCTDVEDNDGDELICKECGHKTTKLKEVLRESLAALLEGDREVAEYGLSQIVTRMMGNKISNAVKSNRLDELSVGGLKLMGNDIYVNGKKVGEYSNDFNDDKGIVVRLASGEQEEFIGVDTMMKYLMQKFNITESEIVNEATVEQKSIVKALRKLARNFKIPHPRFRSLNGRSGIVELFTASDEPIPNKLRKDVVLKIFNALPRDFSDVDYGNVNRNGIALTVGQWEQLLKLHGIDVQYPVTEGKADYEIYHNLYSDAVSAALELANRYGYETDHEDVFHEVSTTPKPKVGETRSFSLPLYKDGKRTKRGLAFQVYGLDSGRYELNAYVS